VNQFRSSDTEGLETNALCWALHSATVTYMLHYE